MYPMRVDNGWDIRPGIWISDEIASDSEAERHIADMLRDESPVIRLEALLNFRKINHSAIEADRHEKALAR